MLFLIIATVVFIVLPSIYILKKIKSFEFLKKINNKYLYNLCVFSPLIIVLVLSYFDMVNTMIVFLHFTIFLLLCDFVIYIIKKIKKINVNNYISVIVTFVITILYLGNAYYLAHHVIRTDYSLITEKELGMDSLRIVQITDSHVGATMNGEDFINYMEEINELNPDIVVVTGDFVDDDTTYEDMVNSSKGLGLLETKYGVFFIYGNHDKGYFDYRGYNDDKIREELAKNNVIILEDQTYDLNNNIVLIGRQDTQTRSRMKMEDLIKTLDTNKYMIVLDHEPNDYENEKNAKVDLVLSGHTHGGQLWPLGQLGVMAKINDAFYGLEKRDNTNFIVSSGIGDWAIKFKTGTVAEYVVIDIKKS